MERVRKSERARERTRLLQRLNRRHYQLSTGAERQQCDVVPVSVFPASCLDVLSCSFFFWSLDIISWSILMNSEH